MTYLAVVAGAIVGVVLAFVVVCWIDKFRE